MLSEQSMNQIPEGQKSEDTALLYDWIQLSLLMTKIALDINLCCGILSALVKSQSVADILFKPGTTIPSKIADICKKPTLTCVIFYSSVPKTIQIKSTFQALH